MAWSDIDFDKIVSGAIASGDTTASYAEILTEFVTAARERSYSVNGQTPPYVNNTFAYIDEEGNTQYGFQKGAILNTGDFKNKIEKLIQMYRLMYAGELNDAGRIDTVWITDDYDINNISDYVLRDADFQALLVGEYGEVRGNELVSIFDGPYFYSLKEIFNADVINSLYLIYGALNKYYSSIIGWNDSNEGSQVGRSLPGYQIYNNTNYAYWGNFGSVTNFLNSWIATTNKFNSTNQSRLQFTGSYTIRTDSGGVRYQMNSGYGTDVQDVVGISIVKKKLDGSTVTPSYKFYWEVLQNYKRSRLRVNNSTLIDEYLLPFTDMFPLVGFDDDEIIIEGTPKETLTIDGVITEKFYILQDDQGNLTNLDFPQPGADAPIRSIGYQTYIAPEAAVIEANNPELDYYIAP